MEVILYLNKSSKNTLDKVLINEKRIDSKSNKELDVVSPLIELTTELSINGYNYLYLPSFERYYFIEEKTMIRNGLIQLSCHCDVLMTYKDKIKLSKANVSNSSVQEPYYNGMTLPTDVRYKVEKYTFPKSFRETGINLMIAVNDRGVSLVG